MSRPYGSGAGGLRIGPGGLSPFIKWMLIINGGVFLWQLIQPSITPVLGLAPQRFFADFPNLTYQIVTYMFLHGGFGHIFFNMFALWMFGTEIERTWGSRTFARFYLLAGIAGAILTIAFPMGASLVIGASGAIWGVLIAYWLMFPNRYLYLYFLFPVKVKWAIPGFLLLSLLFSQGGIAHMAHLGGAAYGFLYLKMDWRWLWLGNRLKSLRHNRQEAKLNKRRMEAEEVMRRVDAILDKINEVGMDNLTKAERKFLEEASSELSRKKK